MNNEGQEAAMQVCTPCRSEDKIETHKLSNGTRVILHPIPGERVDIAVYIEAGSRDEIYGDHPRGVAHFLEHLFCGWREGGEAADGIGMATGLNWMLYDTYNVEAEDVSDTVGRMCDKVCRPVFDDAVMEHQRRIIQLERLKDDREMRSHKWMGLTQAIFGDHPLAEPIVGTRESVASITKADARRFYDENFRAGKAIVAIEGDFDSEAVLAQMEKEFTLPPGGTKRDIPLPYTGGLFLHSETVSGKDVEEARIALGFNCPQPETKDKAVHDVLADVLCNMPNSILQKALRFDRSLVYEIESVPVGESNLLLIAFETYPEYVGTCLETVASELHALVADSGRVSELLEIQKADSAIAEERYFAEPKRGVFTLTRQLSANDKVPHRMAFIDALHAVTPEDLGEAVQNMLSRPPTLVVAGNASCAPSFDKVCALFAPQRPVEPMRADSPKAPRC